MAFSSSPVSIVLRRVLANCCSMLCRCASQHKLLKTLVLYSIIIMELTVEIYIIFDSPPVIVENLSLRLWCNVAKWVLRRLRISLFISWQCTCFTVTCGLKRGHDLIRAACQTRHVWLNIGPLSLSFSTVASMMWSCPWSWLAWPCTCPPASIMMLTGRCTPSTWAPGTQGE